jgi:hypothetical protein
MEPPIAHDEVSIQAFDVVETRRDACTFVNLAAAVTVVP